MPVSRMSRAVAKTKKKPAPGAKRSKGRKRPGKPDGLDNAGRDALALQSAKAEVIASQRYALALESLNENLYDWDIENDSVSWVLFSLVGYGNILAAEGKRQSALRILGLCLNHPETNSDTHRDIQLVLEDLKKMRSDDIETELKKGRSLDLNKTVLMALGG